LSHAPTSHITIFAVEQDIKDHALMKRATDDLSFDVRMHVYASMDEVITVINQTSHEHPVMLRSIGPGQVDRLGEIQQMTEQAPHVPVLLVVKEVNSCVSLVMDALAVGAKDSVSLPKDAVDKNSYQSFAIELERQIAGLTGATPMVQHEMAIQSSGVELETGMANAAFPNGAPKAIAIASSTGGPQALLTLFRGFGDALPKMPIFITQHMPPKFTASLAEHISEISPRPCLEGANGIVVNPQGMWIAPGDYHMVCEERAGALTLQLNQDPPENFCRPAADVMLRSLVPAYGKNLLVLVLTGMGKDGLKGAQMAHEAGATVVAQDEETSAVWGMPRAVAEAGICSAILPLKDISNYIIKACEAHHE
jgi:chemotaxis response regulator CheB